MWRAEIRKLATTRTTKWLWLTAVVVVALGTFSTISSADQDTMSGHLRDQPFHIVTTINLTLVALLVGIRSITDEYRYQTISWTMLSRRRRATALAWKALIAAVAGALIAATAAAIGVGVAIMTMRGSAPDVVFDLADVGAIGGLVVASGMWAVLGVAFGSLIRQQVAAVASSIIWILAIENLGAALLGGVAKLLPGQAGFALADATSDGLGRPAAFALLLGYSVVAGLIAAWAIERRPLLGTG